MTRPIGDVARRLAATLLLASCALAALAQSGALAPGSPPLTQPMVDALAQFYGEIVGAPLDASQKQHLREASIGQWRANDRDKIGNALDLLRIQQEMNKLAGAQRQATLDEFRGQFIPLLRDSAPRDPHARWLVSLHDQVRGRAGGASSASQSRPETGPSFGSGVGPVPPAAGEGIAYAPPPGWSRREAVEGTVFEAVLQPEPNARHRARIVVARPVAAPRGVAAQFDVEWRRLLKDLAAQGSPMDLRWVADKPHFRGRLPGGITAYYMGRAFDLANQTQRLYSVLYVLDLGGRTQAITASTLGAWEGGNFPGATDHSAYWALSQALFPLLESIRGPGRAVAGPLFSQTEVTGNWRMSSFNSGSDFYNRQTGNFVGTQFSAASSQLLLDPKGNYVYQFWLQSANPGVGMATSTASERHEGKWSFAESVIDLKPRQPVSYDPRKMVVGAGIRDTEDGPRRILIVVAPVDRKFKPVDWVPLWDRYDGGGAMNWYVEAGP